MIDFSLKRWTGIRAAALLGVMAAAVLGHDASAQDRYAVRAARVITASADGPFDYSPGVLIVRDGRVEAVGDSALLIPPDVPVLDLPDAVIMPGIVAARSRVVGDHGGQESIGAGYAAIDAFDPYRDLRDFLESGITALHLSPGEHRLIAGQGAVVRSGGAPDDRVLVAHSDLAINLGRGGWSPPDRLEVLIPPASDLAIEPPVPQRPGSRVTQFLALREAIHAATDSNDRMLRGTDIVHMPALRDAWQAERTLRIHANEAVDMEGAALFLHHQGRGGYIVGGAGLAPVANVLARAGVPLVYTLHAPFRRGAADLGLDPNVLEPNMRDLVDAGALRMAFAPAEGVPTADLRMAAATLQRAGLDERRIIEGLTRVPAELLGVSDRIGSLEPGKDADFVVMTGSPLRTTAHVSRVMIRGRTAWRAPSSDALVIHAGAIWRGPGEILHGGSLLVEEGRIVEVGHRVSHPPHARVIDAGSDAWITPGFIDGRGHLGLSGDDRAMPSSLSPARLIGAADRADERVARSGITTQIISSRGILGTGAQMSAVRTAGSDRASRVVAPTAGVIFDIRGGDPLDAVGGLRRRLQDGQRYLDAWKKYESDLAEWKKRQEEGRDAQAVERPAEEAVVRQETDRITGIWAGRISGMPLPEPMDGRVSLTLVGNEFEGRMVEPATDVEHMIRGRLEGETIRGTIEVDTGGVGTPTFEGRFTGEERIEGTITLMGFGVSFTINRVERVAEARVVSRTRRAGADGRPTPPNVDEGLEPIKAVLEGRIPMVVAVQSVPQIRAVVDLVVDRSNARLILVGAEPAHVVADLLREKNVGVLLTPGDLRREQGRTIHQGDRLARAGVRTIYQSGAEDGARSLRDEMIHAVSRGLSADAAIASLTEHAAELYGLSDRIGGLQVGRDADLVIFSGHPMEVGSAVRRVIVGGEEVLP